jgi:hypothetical protein
MQEGIDISVAYRWRSPSLNRRTLVELEKPLPRIVRGVPVPSATPYTYVPRPALDNDQRHIVLSSPAVNIEGPIAPTVTDIGFSYIPDTTSIHLFWDGTNGSSKLLQRRTDGFPQPIPGDDLLISGFPAGLPGVPGQFIYLWPFWMADACQIGFVLGDIGDPRFGHSQVTPEAAAEQIKGGREALGAPLTCRLLAVPLPPLPGDPNPPPAPPPAPPVPPTAPPTPTNPDPTTSPTDNPPRCVMHGTEIVPIGHSPWWTQTLPQNEWHRIILASASGSLNLNATPDHRIYTGRAGLTEMRDVRKHDWIATYLGEMEVLESFAFKRPGFKDCVTMEYGYLFWANGILSHNYKTVR